MIPFRNAMDGDMIDDDIDDRYRRRNLRLKRYDYSLTGYYFLTICTEQRQCLFGDIANGTMELNLMGLAVERVWRAIPEHFPLAVLDEYVVMPNHVHGIIKLMPQSGSAMPKEFQSSMCSANSVLPSKRTSPRRGPARGSISAIVGAFKSTAARRINELRDAPTRSIWQRNYYEHIIRSERSLLRIREYVTNNPLRWTLDRLNPIGRSDPDPM